MPSMEIIDKKEKKIFFRERVKGNNKKNREKTDLNSGLSKKIIIKWHN